MEFVYNSLVQYLFPRLSAAAFNFSLFECGAKSRAASLLNSTNSFNLLQTVENERCKFLVF